MKYLLKRGCGGRTRTYDLRVMSPTSFQLLYPAIFCSLLLQYKYNISFERKMQEFFYIFFKQ